MDRSCALIFNYTKASGLLGKSFIKNKAPVLFQQKSLVDLWILLFKTQPPAVPERLLAERIEKETFSKLIRQYSNFIKQYDNPPEILIEQFRIFEIENLKEIGDALCAGEQKCPDIIPLGKYSSLHTECWPDLKKITEGTVYAWYNKVPEPHEQQAVDFKLDLSLVQSYWKVVNSFTGDEREVQVKLFLDEFVIKNIIWALRLSVYYGMDKAEILKHLFYVTDAPSKNDPVAGPVLKILDKDINDFNQWENWEFAKYLNPHDSPEWKIDPAYIEWKYNQVKEHHALSVFHSQPMSLSALVAWFKIKRYELNCIRTAVESIRFNINSQNAMLSAGVTGN